LCAVKPGPGSGSTDHAFRQFIDAFNHENLATLDHARTSPFAYATNGEVKTFAKYRDFVNFAALHGTGWARTTINLLDVLLNDGTIAVITTKIDAPCRTNPPLAKSI